MNFHFQNNQALTPQSYSSDVLENNWYEDRCTSEFDKRKRTDFMLPNPNSWMFEKTYDELGVNNKNFQKIKEKFSESNDNYINFLDKNYDMYITTTKYIKFFI